MLTDYHLHLRPDQDDTTAERYFTTENVDRYLRAAAAAGVEELGVSEHVYRFRQALELWSPPALAEQRPRRSRCLLRVRPRYAAEARDRVRLRPRRRGKHRDAARGARLRLRRRLGPLHRRAAPSTTPAGTSGTAPATRTRSGGATSSSRRVRPLRPLRHPRPPRPGQGLGRRRGRCPSATCATSTSPRSRRSPQSGIAVEVSTAGLRKPVGELYPARGFAEMCVEAGVPVRALLRRPPPRAGRLRLRRARWSSSTASGWGRYASFEQRRRAARRRCPAASAEWSASATTATASRTGGRWSSAASRSSTSAASPATPTPTSSPTR